MESVDYELAITQDECDGVVLLPGLEGFAVSLRCTEDQMLCDEGCRNFDIDEDHCGEMRSVLPDDVRQRHVQLSCCRISRKKATGRVVLGALRGRETLGCADRDIVTLRDGAMVDGTYADGSPVTASFPDVDVVLLNGLRATCTGDYARLIANACIAALRD